MEFYPSIAGLAKQAWRLLDEPSSLISQVYKGRYFAKKSFLDASMGSRPSYAWWSIMYRPELLEKGLMKTIRDGQNTHVWIDLWILDEVPRRPINKEGQIDMNLKVSHLISLMGGWDQQRLSSLFRRGDITKILSFFPVVTLRDRYI